MSKQKVRKGVITVAGLGTRFLPATKAIPKEMLPVLDKPVVQYIVEEMAASGIKEIIFVVSPAKGAIKSHFERDTKLENQLKKLGKLDRMKSILDLNKKVKFFYAVQKEPRGSGHALLCAKKFLGTEPFAFSDGDSIIDAKTPVVAQILEVFAKVKAPVIGVQKITDKNAMTRYGNVYGQKAKHPRTYIVKEFKEKPAENEVSPLGLIIGGMRYIFTPDIWPFLQSQRSGRDGEIWLTDAANALAQAKPFYAYEYEGTYFDTGNKIALLKTAIHFAKKEEFDINKSV